MGTIGRRSRRKLGTQRSALHRPGRAARSPCVCGDNLFAGCAANRIGSVLLEAQGQKNNLGGSYVEIHS